MSQPGTHDLPTVTREIEEFVASGGWDQPPQLFALVPTEHLLREQPDLAGQVDPSSALTPIAQEALTEPDLGVALASIMWPAAVLGCALAQEIVMLPPEAEADLPEGDSDAMSRIAATHPQAREARLVAAALRDGSVACVLRLRGGDDGTAGGDGDGVDGVDGVDEVIEHPELAANLTAALLETLRE
ncbi:PPA1309 family protein [Actinokineospora sp. NBRC 105648]|uniref:PPA1309 family protein n=1 Tax=Actinokineospora sp. NBRC 105648 TaxID=3032206 RepID=UPI0025525B60|nr:PPA1309 family protein [Actinokineospora sp. NBRC 105648]